MASKIREAISGGFAKIVQKLEGSAEEGKEQDDSKQEITADGELGAARKGLAPLEKADPVDVAKIARKRWDRLNKPARIREAQLKVNFLRYYGMPFVQVHPTDPNRVYLPPGATQRLPPTINKILRGAQRYVAQVTADEPIIEALPANHTDDARDKAEASTHVIRGEWDRMNLHDELQHSVEISSVMRSGFWFFEYDPTEGGRVPAQKFFVDEQTNQRYLAFVNAKGEKVETEEEAAEIWEGSTKVHNLTPMNVRYLGARYAHDAKEVLVGLLTTLRELYEMEPETRKIKVSELCDNVPPDAQMWLEDMRAESFEGFGSRESTDVDEEMTGSSMSEDDARLDQKVFLLHYFIRHNRTYKKGYHCLVVGKHMVRRGKLRYGVIPVVQFKCMNSLKDPYGLALVDVLKDPQDLLDFVNGQILRFLQSLKRRWFVPMHSGVKARDLLSPTRSIIEYNPTAGPPVPEVTPEIPNSLVDWVDRFDAEFDDQLAIHDTMQGKHVPGVSSGRHAEALRSGDETVLGLTRTQIKKGLEPAGRIILEIPRKEWTKARRVSYMGPDREYLELAYAAGDLGDSSKVQLSKASLLMLTPAQKLETLFSYKEMEVLTADDLRRLAPLGDTAGISLTEDPHYQRARRQNMRFLEGPPPKLMEAYEEYVAKNELYSEQLMTIQQRAVMGDDPQMIAPTIQAIEAEVAHCEQKWQAALASFAPDHRPWEDDPVIAKIHAVEHQRALSGQKAERFQEWWVELFEQHCVLEWQIAVGVPQPAAPGAPALPPGPPALAGPPPAPVPPPPMV